MSTIEQAAKRLEQLRRSGVAAAGAVADAVPKLESVPLRVAKQIDGDSGPSVSPRGEEEGSAGVSSEAIQERPPHRRVDIDVALLGANGYITPQVPRSRLAEEFRAIKRPLLNNISGKSAAPVANANRIMVTSALPGEGKTFVSLNLAISLAKEVDARVLLVDADVLRPALLERLGIPPTKGILDLLMQPELDVDDVVLETNVDRLSILPAGTAQGHATELLASQAMSRLVARLATDDPRRIVVFDTPPLLLTSESRVLAGHMGQVILVIASNDTPQGNVAEALSTIENCPVVFTLLNRVEASERGGHYGAYGGGYGYAPKD